MVKEGYKKTKYGLIPDSWGFLQLKDIAKVNMGSSPPSSTYNEDGDGLPFFQGNAEFGSVYPEENQWCTDPQKVADKDNILISVRAPVGDINIAPYECCIGRGLAAIEGEKTSNKFIYYYLKQFNPKLQSYSQGSTFSSINKKVLETFFVNYPPLSEQKEIASILSSVDESIEKTDEVIEETKEMKKGLMQELLTKGIGHSEFKEVRIGPFDFNIPQSWNVIILKDKCDFRQGYQIPRRDQIQKPKEGYKRFLYITDFFSDKSKLFVQDKEKYYYISEEDIAVANTGNTCGKAFRGASGILSNNMFKIFFNNDEINGDYLFNFLKSPLYNKQLDLVINHSGQPHIGHKNMGNIRLPLPSINEQKKIASILLSVDAKIKKEEEYKTKLERLKKGLMQKLLTGEIRVNTEMEV